MLQTSTALAISSAAFTINISGWRRVSALPTLGQNLLAPRRDVLGEGASCGASLARRESAAGFPSRRPPGTRIDGKRFERLQMWRLYR